MAELSCTPESFKNEEKDKKKGGAMGCTRPFVEQIYRGVVFS
jgi:hypothetical protein|tara:strand:+ start:359 stop:484 length:126 start_codon:yes stop_codon:yes gene_type:complete